MKDMYFIDTKIKMPMEEKDLLIREDLIHSIMKNPSVRIIVINAPGGFGKTILTTQIIKRMDLPYIWYRLDNADNDPIVFFYYLFHAVYEKIPDKDKEAPFVFSSLESARINAFHLASIFLEKIKTTGQDFILILDDCHVLNDPCITDFLNYVIKYIPQNLYILVTSRNSLKLDLVKQLASGIAVEINKSSISFSYGEFLNLVYQNDTIPFNQNILGNLKIIYDKSEGWILPLSLCSRMLKQTCRFQDAFKVLQSGEPFFQYFATQIFDRFTEEEKEFLLEISILNQLTPDVCKYITDNPNTKELLQSFADEKNLLTKLKGDQTAYYCHQVVREFLVDMLGEKSDALYIKAGDYYFLQKNYSEAVEYYIQGNCIDKAVNAIRYAGISTIRNGRMKTVERWLSYIEGNDLEDNEGILLVKAFVNLYKGAFDLSDKILNQLQKIDRSKMKLEDYNMEQVIRSRILLYRYSLDQCIECADRIIQSKEENDHYTMYEAYMNKAYGQVLKGDFDDSVITLEEGIETMNRMNCFQLAAFLRRYLLLPYFMKFQYEEALQYYETSYEISDEEINLTERFSIDLYCARIYRDVGRLSEAKALMEKIIRRKHALGYEEDIFAVYYQYATLLRDTGEIDQALKYVSLSEKLFANSGSHMEFSYLVKALKALILSDAEKYEEAYDMVTGALNELILGNSKFMVEVAYFSAGLVAIRNKKLAKAESFLKTGYEMSLKTSLKSMVPVCSGLLIHIYIKNDIRKAAQMAYVSLSNSARQNYFQVYLTNSEMDACIAMGIIYEIEMEFVTAIIRQLNKFRISNILKLLLLYGENNTISRFLQLKTEMCDSMKDAIDMMQLSLITGNQRHIHSFLEATEASGLLNEDIPRMIVRCFGRLQLYCYPYDQNMIKWRTQKAKELMAYLLHHAEKIIRTEQILADLWPDTEVDKARNLFYTNMALVRKVMDECKLKDNLIKMQSGYCLKKDHIICDEWLVEQYSKKALLMEKGINNLLENDYLEDIYSEWAIETRNYYSNFINGTDL